MLIDRSKVYSVNYMTWHDAFVAAVKRELLRRQRINKAYSVRQFSRAVGISIGTVSGLLNQKRRLSSKSAQKVLLKLKLDERENRRILSMMGQDVVIPRIPVDPENFDIYTDWRAQAIVGFFEFEEFSANAETVAERLGLPVDFVESKIQEFIKRKILVREEEKLTKPRQDWFGILPEDVNHKFHQEQLKLAQHALEKLPQSDREFKALTFTAPKDQFDALRTELFKILDRFSAMTETEPKDELYRLSIQLFPFAFPKK